MKLIDKIFGGNQEENTEKEVKDFERVRVPSVSEVSEKGYHNYGSAYTPEFRESVNRLSELFFDDRIESIEVDEEEYNFDSGNHRSDLEDLVGEMEDLYDGVRYTEVDEADGELSVDFYDVTAFYDEHSINRNHVGNSSKRKSRRISEPDDWDFLNGQTTNENTMKDPIPTSSVRIEYKE
jgi:hypothetical protein